MKAYAFLIAVVLGMVPGVAMAGVMQTALSSATTQAQSMAFDWAAEAWPIIAVIVAGGILVTFFSIIRGS